MLWSFGMKFLQGFESKPASSSRTVVSLFQDTLYKATLYKDALHEDTKYKDIFVAGTIPLL